MPDSSLSKLAFAKHNHVVDTYPPTARVRSGSALSKAFSTPRFSGTSRHTLQEQAHFPVHSRTPLALHSFQLCCQMRRHSPRWLFSFGPPSSLATHNLFPPQCCLKQVIVYTPLSAPVFHDDPRT
ncbi:hypothetical protein B0H14DRAFT_3865291 [Mycena olivaceomarginata]|nr:hypothetical protein B0H14DRAFT_3865291 [Mycena olivaceomarginata]